MWPVEHYAALDFGLFGFRAAYLYSICVSFFDSKFKLALGIDNDNPLWYNIEQSNKRPQTSGTIEFVLVWLQSNSDC